ncbi:hypothetical protein K438DRAFT_1756732 [Mycena galopus ATCC 62051]|nr:hypothetical protein K438DRAFT_1756732 [Mycena galopus ATCC 62051]
MLWMLVGGSMSLCHRLHGPMLHQPTKRRAGGIHRQWRAHPRGSEEIGLRRWRAGFLLGEVRMGVVRPTTSGTVLQFQFCVEVMCRRRARATLEDSRAHPTSRRRRRRNADVAMAAESQQQRNRPSPHISLRTDPQWRPGTRPRCTSPPFPSHLERESAPTSCRVPGDHITYWMIKSALEDSAEGVPLLATHFPTQPRPAGPGSVRAALIDEVARETLNSNFGAPTPSRVRVAIAQNRPPPTHCTSQRGRYASVHPGSGTRRKRHRSRNGGDVRVRTPQNKWNRRRVRTRGRQRGSGLKPRAPGLAPHLTSSETPAPVPRPPLPLRHRCYRNRDVRLLCTLRLYVALFPPARDGARADGVLEARRDGDGLDGAARVAVLRSRLQKRPGLRRCDRECQVLARDYSIERVRLRGGRALARATATARFHTYGQAHVPGSDL